MHSDILQALLYLPSSSTNTKSFLIRTPWYTERQEVIMVNVRALHRPKWPMNRLTPYSVSSATTPRRLE